MVFLSHFIARAFLQHFWGQLVNRVNDVISVRGVAVEFREPRMSELAGIAHRGDGGCGLFLDKSSRVPFRSFTAIKKETPLRRLV
jgi:hypothetical protein